MPMDSQAPVGGAPIPPSGSGDYNYDFVDNSAIPQSSSSAYNYDYVDNSAAA